MFEKDPFSQTPKQMKKAEEILADSSLGLVDEKEQDPGQVYDVKSKKAKSIYEAYGFTEEKIALAEKKLEGSELKDTTLEDMDK